MATDVSSHVRSRAVGASASHSGRRSLIMLTRLQNQVALTAAGVVDEQDIGIADGGALISQGLIDRLTRDLDFFATAGVVLADFAPRSSMRSFVRVAKLM